MPDFATLPHQPIPTCQPLPQLAVDVHRDLDACVIVHAVRRDLLDLEVRRAPDRRVGDNPHD